MSRAKYKADAEDLLASWKPILALDGWKIDVIWKRRLRNNRYAETKVQWQYKVAELYFNEALAKKSDLAELEDTIVHELTHNITEPMMDLLDATQPVTEKAKEDMLEMVTTDVSRALIRARNAGMAICADDE